MGLGGFGGGGPEGPPNVTEGAGQAPPPTGCLRPYSFWVARLFCCQGVLSPRVLGLHASGKRCRRLTAMWTSRP